MYLKKEQSRQSEAPPTVLAGAASDDGLTRRLRRRRVSPVFAGLLTVSMSNHEEPRTALVDRPDWAKTLVQLLQVLHRRHLEI